MEWLKELFDRWVWAKREFRSRHSVELLMKRFEQRASNWGRKPQLAYRLDENRLRLRFLGVPTRRSERTQLNWGQGRGLRRDFYGKIFALDEGSVIVGVFRWPIHWWAILLTWFLAIPISAIGLHSYFNFLLVFPLAFFVFAGMMSLDEPYHEAMEDFLVRITTEP
jgi:hypothetical protein